MFTVKLYFIAVHILFIFSSTIKIAETNYKECNVISGTTVIILLLGNRKHNKWF